MLLFVFGLINLSVLGTYCDTDGLVYRVDISLPPKEGRDEASDILSIRDTLKGLTNITVLFSFKRACSWNQLTQYLSSSGYEYSSQTLYHCSDYALDVGLNIPKSMWTTIFEDEEVLIEQKIYSKGLSTDEYKLKMTWKFEKDRDILKSGKRGACFRTLAEYPVQLMYFGQLKPSGIEAIENVVQGSGIVETEVTHVQNLDYYTVQCT